VVGVVGERIRSGRKATSSFASCCIASASPAAQRASIRMLRPSVHPSFCSPSRNAAAKVCPSGSLSAKAIGSPIRRTPSACCPRAASGHAAAPPSTAMNWRRLMGSPLIRGRHPITSLSECRVVHHSIIAPPMTESGHVWTAPAVQEESDYQRSVRVRSCIRPLSAAVWPLALM
jgi:hypothetical protein